MTTSRTPDAPASTCARPTSSTSAGPSPARSRAAPTWSPTPRAVPRQRRAGLPQGRPRRRRRPPARRFGGWSGAHGVQPRPGPLPDRRGAGGPARPVRRRGARRRGRSAGRGRGRRGRRDRPLGLVRRLGRQDRPGRRRRQPGRRAVLQLLLARADRRGRGPRPAGVLAARPGLRGRARSSSPATPAWSPRQRAAPAARDHAGRGAGHLRRARRRGQRAHRRARPRPRRALASHMDVNAHRPHRASGDAELAAALEVAAAENLKRVRPRPGRRARLDRRRRASTR